MAFDISSDFTGLAANIGKAIIVFSSVIVSQVILVRGVSRRKARRMWRLKQFWLPLMAEVTRTEGHGLTLLPLDERQWLGFFHLWNGLQSSLHGEAASRLSRFAHGLGLHHIALRKLLRKSDMVTRLAAMITLGRIRDQRAWEPLLAAMKEAEPISSLTAALALIRIDAWQAMPEVIGQIITRDDWPRDRIANLLQEAGPNAITHPLVDAILAAQGQKAAMLIRYLCFAHLYAINMVVHRMMIEGQESEVLSACLKIAHGPSAIPLIREHLRHPIWTVRVEAVNALGRLGTEEDVPLLSNLLSDREWWVRYRAAQALVGLPNIGIQNIEEILDRQTDPFARDIMVQVLAERGKG